MITCHIFKFYSGRNDFTSKNFTEKSPSSRHRPWATFIAILIPLVFAGCSDKSESKKTPKSKSEKVSKKEKQPVKAKTKDKTVAKPQIAKPDEAIRELMKELAEHRPVAFWNALPASYRSDMNAYVHEFAANMDPELWEDVFQLMRRIDKILKTKKKAALDASVFQLAKNLDRESIEDLWDGYVGLLDIILTNDFADLKKLMRADIGSILAEKGGNAMKLMAAVSNILGNHSLDFFQEDMTSLDVELIESGIHSATLKFTDRTSRNKPFEQKYVLVEGKWVPIQFAQNWQRNIELLRFRLRSRLTPANLALSKKNMKDLLARINPALTKLENAKSEQEFQKALHESGVTKWLFTRFQTTPEIPNVGPLIPNLKSQPKSKQKKSSYKIVIVHSVTRKETDDFAEKFFELIEDIDLSPPVTESGRTIFTVDTKASFTGVLEKLSFVEIVKSDAANGVVEIRLKK